MRPLALILTILSLTVGCAHVQPGVSSMNYDRDTMEVIGPAEGTSSATYLLYFIPTSSEAASVVEATKKAVQSVKADALINTVVDAESGRGIFYSWETIRVHGTAVKFRAEAYGRRGSVANDARTDETLKSIERRLKTR